jgi:hypothetical protein
LRAADVAATSAGGIGGSDGRRNARLDFGASELGARELFGADESERELFGGMKSDPDTNLILARCAKRMTQRDGRFALSPAICRETWICCHAKARSHFWIR